MPIRKQNLAPNLLARVSARWLARHRAREEVADTAAGGVKLIVGLGNPGARYASNRHNVGFMALDRFADEQRLTFARQRFSALLAESRLGATRVLLAKPQTFMNLSGNAVGKLVSFYQIPIHDIIVVYDDLDLPLGRLRIRPRGSAGGHHGMESIRAALGTTEFARLRIGIGRPATREDIGHVLGNFTEAELKALEATLARVANALKIWLSDGITTAMNRFNA